MVCVWNRRRWKKHASWKKRNKQIMACCWRGRIFPPNLFIHTHHLAFAMLIFFFLMTNCKSQLGFPKPVFEDQWSRSAASSTPPCFWQLWNHYLRYVYYLSRLNKLIESQHFHANLAWHTFRFSMLFRCHRIIVFIVISLNHLCK